jgi:hypothetical protein
MQIIKLKTPINWKGIPCLEVSIQDGIIHEFHVITDNMSFWVGNYPDKNREAQDQIDAKQFTLK